MYLIFIVKRWTFYVLFFTILSLSINYVKENFRK